MRPVGAIAARLCWEIDLKPRNRPNVGFSCLKQAYRVAASSSSNLKKHRYLVRKSSVKA